MRVQGQVIHQCAEVFRHVAKGFVPGHVLLAQLENDSTPLFSAFGLTFGAPSMKEVHQDCAGPVRRPCEALVETIEYPENKFDLGKVVDTVSIIWHARPQCLKRGQPEVAQGSDGALDVDASQK